MSKTEPIMLTQEGKKKLEEQLHHLIHEARPEVLEELKIARSQGDLSENADYDAARAHLADIESEILKIDEMLNNCTIIVDNGDRTTVKLGNTVTIHDGGLHKDFTYKILASAEADAFKNIISNVSPLAQAILGHTVGEKVTVQVKKSYTVKILSIE